MQAKVSAEASVEQLKKELTAAQAQIDELQRNATSAGATTQSQQKQQQVIASITCLCVHRTLSPGTQQDS